MTGWIYFVISRKLNSFVSVTVSLFISVYFWHYRFSYERFYNSNSNPLAFYQIVFSRQDAVSYKQYEKIRPDSKWLMKKWLNKIKWNKIIKIMRGTEFSRNLNWNALFISGCSFPHAKKTIGGACWWCMVSIDRSTPLRFELNINLDCYYRRRYTHDAVDPRTARTHAKERIWYLV